MLYNELFKAIGGFGLFLFSLRFLNSVLTNLISNKLKIFIEKFLSNYISCTIFGFITTLFVQASSITIIAGIGLLNNSFITLEQSIFIMLGASLGTTIKGLLFAKSFYSYGSLLIGLTSILLIFIKNQLHRDFLQIFFAIGLAFIGFNIMSESLTPIANYFSSFINIQNENVILSLVLGIVLAIALQSSSTVLFIIIELANQNIINFPIGVSIVLGANIGTTSTILFTSLEYEKNVKRLALSYFIIKFIGVFITIIFFPYFLSFVKSITFSNSVSLNIAFANAVFNLINVIWWHIFYTLIIRVVFYIIPSELKNGRKDNKSIISKMISNSIELTFQEVEIQISKAVNITKNSTDKLFEILISDDKNKYQKETLLDNVEKLKIFIEETLFDMFIRHSFNSSIIEKIKYYVDIINYCNNICNYSIKSVKLLKKGLYIEKFFFPNDMISLIEEFEKTFNNIWLNIILKKEEHIDKDYINQKMSDIENYYFKIISKDNKLTKENITWIYNIIYDLKNLSHMLINLNKAQKSNLVI
ncbi:MAG: phosphate transporter [Candidatus Sericytochromatia bacterium]|nr:MAG: phosphate transporter [Candidatus Sericytochromatia bacterium]